MSNFEGDEIHSQAGGEFPLGLGEVDPQLTKAGRSVEDLSHPEFRLIVLWCVIGQYRASADRQKDETQAAMVTDDARYFQLLSTWTKEARRVYPLIRQKDKLRDIETKITSGNHLEVYNELVELRDYMPELIHPDKRFDLMDMLLMKISEREGGDTLAEIVQQGMLDETLPGGVGFCDDIERLRRYLRLSEINPDYTEIVDNFFGALISRDPTIRSNYFEHSPLDLREFCKTLVRRDCRELALFVTSRGYVDLDNQAILIPLLNDPS